MAAALSVLMTAVIWVTALIGVLSVIVLTIGLFASLNGGQLDLAVGDANADIEPMTIGLALATLIVIFPGIIYVCIQLRRILTTLAEGDPFVPENAGRLSRIAIALGAMELLSIILTLVMRAAISPEDAEFAPDLSINLVVWAAVAALLILSQVFREGTRLRDEEKMTI